MRAYQLALPLLALAFTMTFVEEAGAESIQPNKIRCPPNQGPGCFCNMPYCDHIANPPKYVCFACEDGGCICKSGYYMQDGKCVPASKCRVKCADNMVLQACPKWPYTCTQLYSSPPIVKGCQPRCVCKPGYYLLEEGSQECVPKRKCMRPV